jgi:hypothetical protein
MNEEIIAFFQTNKDEISYLIEDISQTMNNNNNKFKDNRSFIVLQIITEFITINKIDSFLNTLSQILDEETYKIFNNYIKEENNRIIDYENKLQTEDEQNKVVDFEWKFIGLTTLEKYEVGEYIPKILLKLKFGNGKEKIIETDYATFKKFQEEIEENLSAFNSTYSKRINTFSK